MRIQGNALSRMITASFFVVATTVFVWADEPPFEPVATFSILGFDPITGEVGGAVQSRVFAVGNGVLRAEADVGVIATQAVVDVSYGPQGLALLKNGFTPSAVVKTLWEDDTDPRPMRWTKQGRQFAVMNATGVYEAFTGPKASAWAGHQSGTYCTAQGNILAGRSPHEYGGGVRAYGWPFVFAPHGGTGCRTGSWRRYAWDAISRDDYCEEKWWCLVE